MPVHDWTRVPAGIFHAFHTAWLGELQQALNRGALPEGYSALVEQYSGPGNVDVITLRTEDAPAVSGGGGTAVATLADAPPRVARTTACRRTAPRRYPQRSLVIRHRSGRRPVALIELVSEGNKSSRGELERFVDKVVTAVEHGLHTLVVDLHPPTSRDPHGVHGLIGERLGDDYRLDPAKPLAAISYLADEPATVYMQPLAVGDPMPDMPLFLDPGHYVTVPLADTYAEVFSGFPAEERATLSD